MSVIHFIIGFLLLGGTIVATNRAIAKAKRKSCSSCGAIIRPSYIYCGNCGAKLK